MPEASIEKQQFEKIAGPPADAAFEDPQKDIERILQEVNKDHDLKLLIQEIMSWKDSLPTDPQERNAELEALTKIIKSRSGKE